jgi:ubiquinone/menaquinone biosynthesis C-methylase UbiE
LGGVIAWIIFGVIVLVLVGLVLYWQLILAEGAYLGTPLVALLYDWTAPRYNKLKEFDKATENFFVGQPLANRLHRRPESLVLDVATGTGRIPTALFDQPDFRGRVVGLDRASKMLDVARRELTDDNDRLTLIQADAMALPFASNSIPAVTCLEALEFLPDPQQGLAELVRVLQPASETQRDSGWLLTTQRIGWEARLMPGKTWRQKQFEEILAEYPLRYIDIRPWEDIYNQVWAQKVST